MQLENNRVDFYIGLAVDDAYVSVSDWYQSIDTSNVVISKRLDRMVHRTIRREHFLEQNKRAIRVAKRVVVYAMILMSLLFALILSVAAFRNALWNAAVEWFDDHISIRFEQPAVSEDPLDDPSHNAGTTTPDLPAAPSPTTIEEIRKPRDLPDGVEEEIMFETQTMTAIAYYLGDVDLCTFTQAPLSDKDVDHDNDCEIQDVAIHSKHGVALIYSDGRVTITWNDGSYRYKLESAILSMNELIQWAESVS